MNNSERSKMTCYLAFAGATAANVLLVAGPQIAQAQPMLEEVIVTAERRSESLQDVPMSVTVFSGDKVSDAGISGLADIALQTPNLNLTSFNIAEPQIFLRGIGSTNDSAASDPAVAVFVDEVYLGRPGGASTDLYDLDRIEVLRGPQGTLYGKNVAGGAINYFTKKPQQEFEAKAGVTVGDYDYYRLGGYVNGPLTDTLAGKFTASVRERNGYAKNITTGQDLEDLSSQSFRAQLLFTPTDRVDVLLGVDYTDSSSNGESRFITENYTPALTGLASIPALLDIQAESIAGLDERESSHAVIQHSDKEIFGFIGRVDWDTDWAVLTSITAYRESDSSWLQSLTPTEAAPPILTDPSRVPGLSEVNDGANETADQISQEFRLSSEGDILKWVVGLYYIKENVKRDENFETYWDPRTPLAGLSPGNVTYFQDATTESYAVFGQATWNATDWMALTLGTRYTEDDKEITQSAVNNLDTPIGGIPLVAPGYAPVSGSDSWSDTTLRASVDFNVFDQLLYVTYSEGFKSGIFPSTVASAEAAVTAIDPEQATNIEIGAKTEWLDSRLRFNIAYFDLDYEDLQVFFLQDNVLNTGNADAEVSGVELDFAAAIAESFMLTGSFATMDGEYSEYVIDEDNFTGNDLTRAPEDTWTLTGTYTVPFGSGATLDLVATVSHTGDFFHEASNDERSFQDGYEIWDASANYTSANGEWSLSLWGKNLDDELYAAHKILGTLGGVTNLWAAPRTYGASFTYNWL